MLTAEAGSVGWFSRKPAGISIRFPEIDRAQCDERGRIHKRMVCSGRGRVMAAVLSASEALLYLSQQETRRKVRAWLAEYGDAPAAFERQGKPPRWPVDRLRAAGIRFTVLGDEDFPEPLQHIPDPPLVVYYRGALGAGQQLRVAVVGARTATRRGLQLAESLGRNLARAGATVVSGLARGIDGAAHRGVLAAESGGACAVLGSGLQDVYPREHRGLAERIIEAGGAVLSEYAPHAAPFKGHFPERNRLISGLCHGVVVVEASRRSGSLITARMAGEQGRDVMAVPGPVGNPLSAGCHWLIKQGAALVEDADDILAELGHAPAGGEQPPHPPPELAPVYEAVTKLEATPDEIAVTLGLPADAVIGALVQLELAGFVRLTPDGYIRAPR